MGYTYGAELSIAVRIRFRDLLNQLTETNCQKIFIDLANEIEFDLKDNNECQEEYKNIIYDKNETLSTNFVFTPENVREFFTNVEGIKNFNFIDEYIYLEPDKYKNKEKCTILIDNSPNTFGQCSKHIGFNEITSKMPEIIQYIKDIELVSRYEIIIKQKAYYYC